MDIGSRIPCEIVMIIVSSCDSLGFPTLTSALCRNVGLDSNALVLHHLQVTINKTFIRTHCTPVVEQALVARPTSIICITFCSILIVTELAWFWTCSNHIFKLNIMNWMFWWLIVLEYAWAMIFLFHKCAYSWDTLILR